ncbi:hypothetical protein PUNSTDRAFT_53192 [Punctularia strigosozonata HHB-11173 SS5]|uniref:uncharacterized protein n=1 Tax=Punctularia strigosozonata (strain HHB-11173) TaxID=741275 RepID=UPI0004418288|nr:uncharacterized protein PUNSTDRAFT_53192 [Punctularia strigosozonata HHB-11173 SS5]EIN07837.1 hypothetical protein PUNSTDRAFT_53192 [Punctularia strigosozonata HHB-11173 SS5]
MAGLRASIIICLTSFLLGVLFTNWIADSLTLWKNPVTDEALWTSARYYSILASLPANMAWALAAVVGLGGLALASSMARGQAGNLMFDGGSIFLFVSALAVQLRTVVPTIRERFTRPNVLDLVPERTGNVKHPFPVTLRSPLLDVASANVICSVALTGVLVFQAARWWAEEKDTDGDGDDDNDDDEHVENAASSAPATAPQSDASPRLEKLPSKVAARPGAGGKKKRLPVQPKAAL